MTDTAPLFSIIIPVYNGEQFIKNTLQRVSDFIAQQHSVELVLVNDGSTDGTKAIVDSWRAAFPFCQIVQLPQNCGKGVAVKAGIHASHGQAVGFTDADLPYGLAIMSQMQQILAQSTAQLAYGSRSHPQSQGRGSYGSLRQLGRNFFSAVVRLLVLPDVLDTQCGVKMMTRSFADLVVQKSAVDRFAFDIELFAIARANQRGIQEMPVSLSHRKESSVRIVKDTLRMLRDILFIRRRFRSDAYKQ